MVEPIKVVADILQNQLGLADDQVMLYNQKFDIPPDDRLYISLAVLATRTFGVQNRHLVVPTLDGADFLSVLSSNRQETYQITIFSRSSEARTRNWEIPPALASDTSERMQEANNIRIGYLPSSMNDVSALDGTAILNSYALTIQVLAAYEKVQPEPYYDKFSIPPKVTIQQ